jgi:hypothetical protein
MKHRHAHLAAACLALAASFTASFTATAAPVTKAVPLENWTPNSASLVWSATAISATNAIGGQIDKVGLAKIQAPIQSRLKYTAMTHNMPLSSLTYDDVDGKLLNAQFKGGLKLSAEMDGLTTTGGTITIDDLFVDFQAQKVFANVTGPMTVLMEDVPLWTFTGGAGSITASGSAFLSIPNLTITAEGFAAFDRNMNLLLDGEAAWSKVTSFGSITSAVPEPGTYGLMLLGMAGLAAVASRGRQHRF